MTMAQKTPHSRPKRADSKLASTAAKNVVDLEHPPLAFDLLKAVQWMEDAMERSLLAMNVHAVAKTPGVLLAHVGRGETRPARLARLLGVSRQAVSVMIADLVQQGILVVGPDPDHARASIVQFSQSYAPVAKTILKTLTAIEAHLGTVIGEDRLTVLRHSLRADWGEPAVVHVSAPATQHHFVAKNSQQRGRRRPSSSTKR